MCKITKDLIQEFQTCQQRIEDISCMLLEKAEEVANWEEKNLGKKKPIIGFLDKVEIDENTVEFFTHESWAYGGYEEYTCCFNINKLISDDWREEALKEHNKKLEQERKKKN